MQEQDDVVPEHSTWYCGEYHRIKRKWYVRSGEFFENFGKNIKKYLTRIIREIIIIMIKIIYYIKTYGQAIAKSKIKNNKNQR